MTKTTIIKIFFDAGILIVIISFFLNWFSCKFLDRGIDISLKFIDLFKYEVDIFCLPYLACLAFAIYLVYKLDIKKNFIFFLLTFILLFLCLNRIFWFMTEIGAHITVDIPCDPEPGFWLNALGVSLLPIRGFLKPSKQA